ncbi:hypothetical protein I3271_05425 [Photobacterium leiognathi]|uniref:hypothetical protein n=1 Tax=Photobacterium leiognathi TaxID=553611 RepID=UPI001EDF4619|nr:hypothetical protein [Photobacterium leiognathi]MCG3884121.1 hypothetical protein [Photobacterium leiognathi]
MTMKKRYSGHSALNDVIRADWMKAIELSPDSYQALLYVPKQQGEVEQQDSNNYEAEEINELDTNQDELIYDTPFIVSVLDCPDENEFFLTSSLDNENTGEYDTPLLLRVAHDAVPVGSILEWEEETTPNTTRRCWWYVHSAQGFGTANVGSLYVCIPARNFDDKSTQPEQITNDVDLDVEPPATEQEYGFYE